MRHLIHLSDLHVGKTEAEGPAFERLLDHVATLHPEGIIVSGDLVDDPNDHALIREVRERFERTGLPFVAVPGNHDVQTPGEPGPFEAEFGPVVRLEVLAGVEVLLFDSFDGLPVAERTDWDRACFDSTGCWGDGRVAQDQFAYFEARLASRTAALRLAVVHHHLEDTGDDKVNPLHNAAEFGAWCVDHDVGHVFVGHLHETVPSKVVHGVMRHRIGRSTKPPFPFGVFDLVSERYEARSLDAE